MGADWVPPLVNDVIVGSPGRSNSLVRSSACPSTSRYCADYHHLVSFFVHQRPTYKMKQVLTSVFEIFDLNHQNTRPCKYCLHKLTSLSCFSYNLSLLWRISWSWVSPCLLLSPQIAKRSWVLVMVRLEWDKCIISWGLDKSTLGWISWPPNPFLFRRMGRILKTFFCSFEVCLSDWGHWDIVSETSFLLKQCPGDLFIQKFIWVLHSFAVKTCARLNMSTTNFWPCAPA